MLLWDGFVRMSVVYVSGGSTARRTTHSTREGGELRVEVRVRWKRVQGVYHGVG